MAASKLRLNVQVPCLSFMFHSIPFKNCVSLGLCEEHYHAGSPLFDMDTHLFYQRALSRRVLLGLPIFLETASLRQVETYFENVGMEPWPLTTNTLLTLVLFNCLKSSQYAL